MKFRIPILLAWGIAALISCRESNKSVNSGPVTENITDTGTGLLVAENIIQDIIIKNNDPENAWAEECLKGMDRSNLVDIVFELAYSGKAITYDFDTEEKLTLKQLKLIEKKEGFSRDKVGKIQFVESWYFDPAQVAMTKKVSSIVLGYETFDSHGEFRGYLPVFRMVLN